MCFVADGYNAYYIAVANLAICILCLVVKGKK